ncbi:hypothetical protein FE257_002413 [Aspergillus nanangensis]|uniref:Zn(2)-C6 fungal-type domain-containing protein n=1 Tax=Aspergillus nanangensis TaxID=2582783 RepID=A0AAD4CCW5_ASPNN|nr:hypothetical protein FE257_002413 [Aspergillus nanangensis]
MVIKRSSTSSESSSNQASRKRSIRACDRCKLKKAKCDGDNPCHRCNSDMSPCVFGKKTQSKRVYAKGYVDLLERQHERLIHGVQRMYDLVRERQGWQGEPLPCGPDGHPLTHDILSRLSVLEVETDHDDQQAGGISRRPDTSTALLPGSPTFSEVLAWQQVSWSSRTQQY